MRMGMCADVYRHVYHPAYRHVSFRCSAQHTVYGIKHAAYSITVYSIQHMVYGIQCTVLQYSVCSMQCTVRSAQYTGARYIKKTAYAIFSTQHYSIMLSTALSTQRYLRLRLCQALHAAALVPRRQLGLGPSADPCFGRSHADGQTPTAACAPI